MQMLNANIFSIRKACNMLRGSVSHVQWRKISFNNPAQPKCIFIGWLATHGRLVTCDRILRFGVHCDPNCVLCNHVIETGNHRFFECSFAANIWEDILCWLGYTRLDTSWQGEIQIVTQMRGNSTKQQMYQMALLTLVYYI